MTLEAVLAHISRQNLNYLYEKKKKEKRKKKSNICLVIPRIHSSQQTRETVSLYNFHFPSEQGGKKMRNRIRKKMVVGWLRSLDKKSLEWATPHWR